MGKVSKRPRAAVYVRVSMVGQRDRGSARYQTEAEQEERSRAYAASRGYDVALVASDVDVSGAKWERQGLDLVLAAAEAGEIQALVVYRLARLGRNLRRVLETAEELDRLGVTLLAVEEGIDRSTAGGRMLFNVLASFAEYERELRGEYWAGSQARASERGVLLARTPFGYQRRDDGILEPDTAAAPVVEELFERRAAGETISSLCDWLDERSPRPDGRLWQTSRVGQTLQLRVYLGEITRGGKVWTGTHDPIVDPVLFDRVQDRLVRRSSPSDIHDFALSGLIRCGSCGGPMSGVARGGANRETPVYRCRKRGLDKVCDAPAVIVASRVEGYVVPMVLDRMRELASRTTGVGRDDLTGKLEAADGEIAELAAEQERITGDLGLRRDLGYDQWRATLVATARGLAAAREGRAALASQIASVDREAIAVDQIAMDPEQIRVALRSDLARVVVRRGRGAPADRVTVEFVSGLVV